jgi:hypothetical protein
VLSGGADKLVPYARSEAFLSVLKSAATADGRWEAQGEGKREKARRVLSVEDRVYDGVGHEFTADMMRDAVRFIVNQVAVASMDGGRRRDLSEDHGLTARI